MNVPFTYYTFIQSILQWLGKKHFKLLNFSRALTTYTITLLSGANLIGQAINPWTNLQTGCTHNKTELKNGIFDGYQAQYGLIAHKNIALNYKALPFLLLPSYSPNSKHVLVVLNGGPGISNLALPMGTDSLLYYFNILIPGYRGVDDVFFHAYQTPDYEQINHLSDIKLIAHDISNIVNELGFDTVYIAAHSFGTVYGCEYLSIDDNTIKTSFFFSPLMTHDIVLVVKSMERMIENYFRAFCTDSNLYPTILDKISEADNPGILSMGLLFMFTEYRNGEQIDILSNPCASIIDLLQASYNAGINRVVLKDKNRKLSDLFCCRTNTKDTDMGRLGKYLHSYFTLTIDEHGRSVTLLTSCSPDLIINAQYDYSVSPVGIVVENSGHADIWRSAWQYIINFHNQQHSTNK